MVDVFTILSIVILLVIILIALSGVRIVQPYEQGLFILLGKFRRKLNPGFNWVWPLVSQVVKLDLRTQVLDVPRQEVITKDNSPTNVDAIVYIRVVSPDKAFFEVTNYKMATIALAQTTLRSVIGDMELDEILYNREAINARLRDILDEATDHWGVKVEAVEIREVDPVGRVKQAMEEQTSAERERRAAILRADGEKRAKILSAEGDKRSRILQAEGVRQSKILEAEGSRLARILESQGQAQSLRILSLGSATLDHRSLAVLSMDTVKSLGEGQATKIVLPFEVSRLVDAISTHMGAAPSQPPASPADVSDLEKVIGPSHTVLGRIPDPDEISRDLETIEAEMAAESKETEEIAHIAEGSPKAKAPSKPKDAKDPKDTKDAKGTKDPTGTSN
ncbi:MAG: SPFH domain-containing protein [Thermoplasmatota archaeon]